MSKAVAKHVVTDRKTLEKMLKADVIKMALSMNIKEDDLKTHKSAENVSGDHLRVLIKFLDMPDNKMELKKKLVNINDYWMEVLTKAKAK